MVAILSYKSYDNLIGRLTILMILAVVPMLGQVTLKELAKSMKIDTLRHPYLFFNQEEKTVLLHRIETDPEAKTIMAGLLAEGHRFLYVPVKESPPLRMKHPRYAASGDAYNSYASELSEGAVKLAFLFQLTGESRYARKAIEFAVALCDLDDWVEQAHKFDIIYPRVWPWNVPDDQVVFSYDIFTADKAIAVATVYDWVYPALTKWERDKIRNGLLEKVITRVRGNYDFFWWSTAYRCNWSAICFSGLGIAAVSLLKENPQLLDVVVEAYNRIGLTFDQVGNDGGWQEGRGYYGYMMRATVPFMEIVKRLSGGRCDLFTHKSIIHHPFDFLLYGMTANFEDSEGGVVGTSAMVNKLTEETGSTTGAWYREKFFGEGTTLFDILWPRPKVKALEPRQKSMWFKSIHWAMMRSNFSDPSTVTIACKAGYNDDPHHGHLDCGQFVLTWHNIPFIRDIGRMRYDEIYFNEERWLYPYASSEGHNLIFVNGEQQLPAKLKNKPWREGLGGEILKFESDAKRDYVLMDPTHTYPGEELKKWRRSIILEKPVTTVIVDEIETAPGASIEARFFPAVASQPIRPGREARVPSIAGVECTMFRDHVVLSSQQRSMVLIPLVLNNVSNIIEGKLPAMPVTEEPQLTWIPYLSTMTKAASNATILVTIILPVHDNLEAAGVVNTAKVLQITPDQLEVSIDASATKYRWRFTREKDGFVLRQ
ncbi:MAG: heparinase II/III family protein [bacterium]